jgi:hypothetical protein
MNIPIRPFVKSFGSISRSETPGPYCNSMFNLLLICQADFHSSCTLLHSRQQCVRILISAHPQQNLLFSLLSSVFFIMPILVGVTCMVLFPFFAFPRRLMMLHIFAWASCLFEHLLWKNVYSSPLPTFKTWDWLPLCCGVPCIVWKTYPYQTGDL